MALPISLIPSWQQAGGHSRKDEDHETHTSLCRYRGNHIIARRVDVGIRWAAGNQGSLRLRAGCQRAADRPLRYRQGTSA